MIVSRLSDEMSVNCLLFSISKLPWISWRPFKDREPDADVATATSPVNVEHDFAKLDATAALDNVVVDALQLFTGFALADFLH